LRGNRQGIFAKSVTGESQRPQRAPACLANARFGGPEEL
jgi:hypothetical protein